ncbi:hypothetical protein ACFP6B_08540 [Rothia nasimurium]|uniref:hypothetical protein n=1 Tax=Rothia nasimurium TaxID=85336 RepID=UPI00360DC795
MKRPDIIWSEIAHAVADVEIDETTHPHLTEEEREDCMHHIKRLIFQWHCVAGAFTDILEQQQGTK